VEEFASALVSRAYLLIKPIAYSRHVRTKGCAPNASTVECSGEVRYLKFDFLFLQPDPLEIGMRVDN
jgi:hypothetical protein